MTIIIARQLQVLQQRSELVDRNSVSFRNKPDILESHDSMIVCAIIWKPGFIVHPDSCLHIFKLLLFILSYFNTLTAMTR